MSVRERIDEILRRVRPQSSISKQKLIGGGTMTENIRKRMESRLERIKGARPGLLETSIKRLEEFKLGKRIKEVLPEEVKE